MNDDQPKRRRKTWIGVIVGVVVVAIVVAVIALRPASGTWNRTSAVFWSQVPSDDSALSVVVLGAYGPDVGVRVQVTQQSAKSVVLQGWTYDLPGIHMAMGVPMTVVVHLAAPLGNRLVLRPDGSAVTESDR